MNNKGFTLIELLVVVLIIGILAAIALPQYTKAVERSRMAEAVQVLGDLATAESIHFMQNNVFESRSAGQATTGDVTVTLPNDDKRWSVKATAEDDNSSVVLEAERKGGMYSAGKLFLRVYNDGAIVKCVTDTAGFKDLASTAGYSKTAAAAANCTK